MLVSHHSPMDQYTSATIKSFLDESIAGGEMLQDVLILDVIYLNEVVLVWRKQTLVNGKADCGHHMRDVGMF